MPRPAQPCLRTVAFAVILMGVVKMAHSEQQARLSDGTRMTGQLRGQSPEELRFLVAGKPVSLKGIERIECPRSSPALQNRRPARVFHLRGGGQITGELIRFTDERITIHAREKDIPLPRPAVLAIDQLQGEQQVVYEDFSAGDLSPVWKKTGEARISRLGKRSALQLLPKSSLTYSLENPVAGARFSVAFFDPQPAGKSSTVGLELEFSDHQTAGSATIFLASPQAFLSARSRSLRLTNQPLRRESGWRRLTVLFDETRFQVLVDSHLLAFGRPPNAPLKSLRLFSEPVPNSAEQPASGFGLAEAELTQLVPRCEEPNPITFDKQAQFIARSGDVIYGKVLEIHSEHLRLKGAFGEAELPWRQLRRVVFPDSQEPSSQAEPSSPLGWQANVSFQRFVDHPHQPGDLLQAAILSAEADSITLHHPWLGTLEVPWEQVDFIEPRFWGRSQILSPDVRHLGNQTRREFRHPEPQGIAWRGEFSLEKIPSGAAFLRVQVAELEPAGSGTPPGSRYLSELRNGHLGTEVFLNGQSLGRLNDKIAQRNPVGSPQTIRLPIPAQRLRAGKNLWRMEQTPLRENAKEFDDCEIGPLVLEIEASGAD